MAKYGMVINLERCMGCNACVEACKIENNTGQGMFWMHVFRLETGEYPNANWLFMPRPCMHCDNAPCIKVCPTGARFKREDSLVLTDFDRCIGCRYCEVACPYGVNYFNWKRPEKNQYYDWNGAEGDNVYGTGVVHTAISGVGGLTAIPPYQNPDHKKLYAERLVAGDGHYKGVVGKCTFCVHRLAKGLLPACVANCPVHVFHFGDLDDPSSEVSKLLGEKQSFRLLEETGTQPRVYYIQGTAPMPDLAEVRR